MRGLFFTTGLTCTLLHIFVITACSSGRGNHLKSKSGSDLQSLLDQASPGDTIELLPIDYTGDFILADKGSSGIVTLKGTSINEKSTTILGSKKAISILGGSWCVKNLAIGSGHQGIAVKGSKNSLKSLSIIGVDQGVIINGDSNKLKSISITGGDQGIIIKGDRNELLQTSCTGQSSYAVNLMSGEGTHIQSLSVSDAQKYSLALAEGTCCGDMESLSLAGLLEIKGRSYNFNSVSSSDAVNVLGCENSFTYSYMQQVFMTKDCKNSLTDSNYIQTYLTEAYKV